MKRDWDLVREILLKVESDTTDNEVLTPSSFPDEKKREVAYHVELLVEADLIDGRVIKTMHSGPAEFIVMRLTWSGHEFLD